MRSRTIIAFLAGWNTLLLIRELGLESVVFNPCGNTPEQGDFLSVMRHNIGGIKRIASRSRRPD